MGRVRTGSRLHFGLLNLAEVAGPFRRFGGVGLMVEVPGVEVEAVTASSWSAEGPEGERILRFVQRAADSLRQEQGRVVQALHLRALSVPPAHVGLGSGTQLALAAARAASDVWGVTATALDLARWTGRGLRSGLGVHGFAHGGLLVDGGRGTSPGIAPLVARLDFPAAWRVVLAIPIRPSSGAEGLHGAEERNAFTICGPAADRQVEVLCRLVLLGLLPAAVEQDIAAFGEALYELNRRVGEAFAPVQGGVYASPAVAGLVAWFRNRGIHGVGQSSWGPTVFAIVGDPEHAADIAGNLHASTLGPLQVVVTAGRDVGQVQ